MQHLTNSLTKLSGEKNKRRKRQKKTELTMIFTEFFTFSQSTKFFCHQSPNTVGYALRKQCNVFVTPAAAVVAASPPVWHWMLLCKSFCCFLFYGCRTTMMKNWVVFSTTSA